MLVRSLPFQGKEPGSSPGRDAKFYRSSHEKVLVCLDSTQPGAGLRAVLHGFESHMIDQVMCISFNAEQHGGAT